MGFHLLLGAAFFGASVQAYAFPSPRPTDPYEALPFNGWSPRPTPAPDAHLLLGRRINLPETYLVAPDNTCGFINGNPKSAYECPDDDMQCVFIPTSGKVPGAAGCCKDDACDFRISCVEKADIKDCDKACQADALTLKCTGAARFCGTVAFPGGVTDYYCSTKEAKSALTAQTTASGGKSRSMSTVKPTSSSTSKKSSTSSTSSSSSSSLSASSSSSTSSGTSSSSTQSTSTPATDTAAASAATSSAAPATSDAPSTPTGAIIGGAVGGVAVIALIIFGAVFLRQNRKKYAGMDDLPPPQPFMAEPSLATAQPPTASSGMSYAPSSHSLSSASATPAQMYAAPATAAAGAGAGAAASFASYHNHHNNLQPNAYPEPSPMTTPSGSPGPHYPHQPHAPQPLPPPSYYHAHNYNSPGQSPDGDDGIASATGQPPNRSDSSTPVSTYNGTIPVSPASALGPMPGEHQQQQQSAGGGGVMGGVPLALQPGMGYRPYSPGGSSAVTAASSASSEVGSSGGKVVRSVSGSQPPAEQGLGIRGMDGLGPAGGKGGAVELP
ncbi:hypothetical protein N657DRAFT_634745 [Parathielavia appendiculata]|uniref:Uncharacterized protein n=1 Tax=Parathielavia appendiculata TaxID=2587402 RepID=A0AAN6Z2M5_9PEZI|nr:hypothetical protein N657DRAFT_634745 [Parathielavia appendiculata]